MPQLDDLGDFLSPTLDLPVAGKVYSVPSPPARVGLHLQAVWAISAARQANEDPAPATMHGFDEDHETSLEQDALGPVYDEMLADGASIEVLNHAGMAAYLWVVAGEKAARLWWVSPLGEAHRPETPSTSTSTGEANETPTPASTSGTRSPTSGGEHTSSTPTG